ncbi:MAG: insulinase family protein [Undibacterium sp.]|nr:insulinase family protein [Undibacterium sp.]
MRSFISKVLVCTGAVLSTILTGVIGVASAEVNLKAVIPTSPQLIKGQLKNGLTYYIQKNAKPEKKLELRLVVKTGSVMEDDDQQGLAHFTEHMAFNGSQHFKKNELVSFLEGIGVKFGADLNAYTSFDETVYILPLPTDKPENVEKGFLVLSDWASGLRFDHEEIDKERGVVLEEARLGKGAGDRIRKQILPKILYGSKYADRLPIGKEELLKNFKYEALERFYADWYRPNLMAVVVVGDIEPEHAKHLIEKNFAGLKNPTKPRERTLASIPLKNIGEALVATDKEVNISSISISQTRFLNKNDGKFGSYRDRRIQNFFNVMLGNRLQELTQLPNPPFLGGGSGVSGIIGDYQELNSSAAIGKAGVQAAIDALMQENKRVAKFGFNAAELERAKKNSLRSMEDEYNERNKTVSSALAEEFIRHFLNGEAIPGIEAEYVFHKEIVQGIKLDEVNRFARSLLVNESPQLLVYQGNDQPDHVIPSSKELVDMVQVAKKKEVLAYSEKILDKSLFDTPPQAGKIIAEVSDERLGTTSLTLSNGVKVVLKTTDFKSDEILIGATRAGGTGVLPDADLLQAGFATSVVGAMGIKSWSPIELTKILAGKSASVSTHFSETHEGVSGVSNKDDLETMLQMLSLVMTQPRKDEDIFKSFVGKQQDVLKNNMLNPMSVYQEAVLNATFSAHPRKPIFTKPEHIAQLNLERVMSIYRSRFSSAKGLTFFMVGSFELEKVKPLIATYIASLPAPDIEIASKDSGLRPNSGIVKKEVFAGKEPLSVVSLQMHGERAMSNADRLRFNAMVEVMQLRLTAKMREEMGAVYSPNVSGQTRRIPYQGYSLFFGMPCAPENVDRLLQSSFDLIAQMKAAPPTEEELNKVKENWLKNRRESMKTNRFWLSHLERALQNNDDPQEVFSFEERIKALSAKDVQEAAQIYLDVNNYIQVVMYPEKKEN